MSDTANFAWTKPTVGGDSGTWGTVLNAALDAADASLKTVQDKAVGAPRAALGTSGTVTMDLAASGLPRSFTITPSGSATFAFSNVPSGAFSTGVVLKIANSGGHAISWPASVKWPAGSAPSLVTAGTHVVTLVTFDNGTTWQGSALLSLA